MQEEEHLLSMTKSLYVGKPNIGNRAKLLESAERYPRPRVVYE